MECEDSVKTEESKENAGKSEENESPLNCPEIK